MAKRSKSKKDKGSKSRNGLLYLLLLCIGSVVVFPFLSPYIDDASSTRLNELLDMARKHQGFGLEKMKESASLTALKAGETSPKSVSREGHHLVAGLSCEKYGGPLDEDAAEMVYWEDIPSDAFFVSPLNTSTSDSPKYLTFEPDEGGWNNIRMAMETAVTMALAMGRTLVMPPELRMYLLWNSEKDQKFQFGFSDFFHFDSVEKEHKAIDIITFEEFLKREALTGKLRNQQTGQISFPPENRTNWNQFMDNWSGNQKEVLFKWLRSVTRTLEWNFNQCVAGFPASPGPEGRVRLQSIFQKGCCSRSYEERMAYFVGNPTPVDAAPEKRLEEIIAKREHMCMYGERLQQEKVVHLTGDNKAFRMLIHFYAFLFFEDWKQDVWTKRFVRDHLRYINEIQCQAAKVVKAIRDKARENGDPDGLFDTMHIRRGDFQYQDTRIDIHQIYDNVRDVLRENSTLFIATDERDKTFFEPLKKHYNVYFLDDFQHLLRVNTNFYGMLDQLITSRGRVFIGTFFSTFTGYINRMRGYHSQKQKNPGFEEGIVNSYHFIPQNQKYSLRMYRGVQEPFWSREFPIGWRDLNKGIGELPIQQ